MNALHPGPIGVSRANLLAAIYVPSFVPTPADLIERRMQLVVGETETRRVMVVPPSRRIRSEGVQEDRVILALSPELIGDLGERIYAQEACDPYLYGIAHSIKCGFRAGRLPPERYLESLAPGIALHLRDHYPVRSRTRHRSGLGPDRLWRALALIEKRFAESLAVEEIAEEVGLSAFYFARMFRRSTGLSPHTFITKRRMDQAKLLLATTSQPMGRIALAVGYRRQAHFTSVFHTVVGMTPRRFRRERRSLVGDAI